MAYTTINKSTEHFNAKIYTGTGSSQSITGVGFQPDFTWIKQRSGVEQHVLFDAIRGVQKYIASNTTATESTTATTLTAFNSDGFTEGGHGMTGANGSTYASWNWKANGAGSANTDGTISSTVSANTTSGFSIVKYTGTGVTGATVGHGLGAVPKMIIIKTINNSAEHWFVYHASLGNNKDLLLNLTNDATNTVTTWNNTTPTSTVWTMSNQSAINSTDGNDHIAYCFAEKQGFSKFGSYVGNGSTDGTFVYTGFKPAFVIVKCSTTAADWELSDNKRTTSGGNVIDKELRPNTNGAETGGTDGRYIDYVSNGFKLRQGFGNWNASGATYIYMAFAEEPLVGDNPATAR